MKDCVVFCDFDGTITKEDTVCRFLDLYAEKEWRNLEDLCIEGKLSPRVCMEKQLSLVKPPAEFQMKSFINNLEIDETFISFFKYVRELGVEFNIVSDGLDYFIQAILSRYSLKGIKVFSNKLVFDNGNLIPSFPFYHDSCKRGSGVCKCSLLEKYKKTKKTVYIGDGVSDYCASGTADFLFAKKRLASYCTENKIPFTKFEFFSDIHSYFLHSENAL